MKKFCLVSYHQQIGVDVISTSGTSRAGRVKSNPKYYHIMFLGSLPSRESRAPHKQNSQKDQ